MVYDDKLEFLRGLSELAARGGGDVMLAWHMYERAKEADQETGANKEFNKLRKEAEKSMEERSHRDQALLAAKQLGLGSASASGSYGRAAQREAIDMADRQQRQREDSDRGVDYGNRYGQPPPERQQRQREGGDRGAGYMDWDRQPPPPPPVRPMPRQGSADFQRNRAAAEQQRGEFDLAEVVLGGRCPADLKGCYIPVGARFKKQGRQLCDRIKVRDTPFPYPCMQCGKVGHEGFECKEKFKIKGKKAFSSRQLYEREPRLCDETGAYQQ